MGISKLPGDAKALVQNHKTRLSMLARTREKPALLESRVKEAVEQALSDQVLAVLKTIPVEEINRSGKSIRVKTLRDQGYETVADLQRADQRKLAAINGISDSGAAEIKAIVAEMAKQARQGMKLRLSSDNRTPGSTALILALYRYERSAKALESCGKLLMQCESSIRRACADVETALGGLRWLFLGKEKKEKAGRAYQYLLTMMEGTYGTQTGRLLGLLQAIDGCSKEKAWDAFTQNPIPFFNTLEAICPGVLGTGDSMYGLPEDLAHQIQQQPLHLEGLRCTLRRYQEWGVKYILHQKRVLLGDEMGLGKTVQAIASMVSLKNTGSTHFLVVCPASVLENWCREIRKHSPIPVYKVHGLQREEALQSWQQEGGAAVTTYETTGAITLPEDFTMDLLVVDEAHYIKNPQAQRTVRVRTLCALAKGVLFMTGTALENRVDEMMNLITILQPQVALAVKDLVSLSSAPQFREGIAPVYYRRKRDDVLTELPELIENEEWCELGQNEELAYENAVLDHNFAEARRVSWNVQDPMDSSKARRMLEIIQEARGENRKIIVFSFFLDTIETVRKLLGDRCSEPINGSVPPQRRQEILDEFEKAPAGQVLAAQILAGGTGLNIQSASVVILCEPQLKPSTENQAIARAYRMGQTRNVLVYRLLCENTIDERITELLAMKQKEFDTFADPSAAAEDSAQLDGAAISGIIDSEIDRIRDKNRETGEASDAPEAPGEAPEAAPETV